MPSFFSRLKGKDGPAKVPKIKKGAQQRVVDAAPPKPQWEDAWTRTSVDPEEVQELIKGCTVELKSRGTSLLSAFPLSNMHQAIATYCRVTRANCYSLQHWICHSSFSPSDLHQIRVLPEPLSDTSLIGPSDYMVRFWHKSYG